MKKLILGLLLLLAMSASSQTWGVPQRSNPMPGDTLEASMIIIDTAAFRTADGTDAIKNGVHYAVVFANQDSSGNFTSSFFKTAGNIYYVEGYYIYNDGDVRTVYLDANKKPLMKELIVLMSFPSILLNPNFKQ